MLNDVRYALRSLSKNPGTTFTIVLCLGLGIGANTTIFSLTNAVFLRPLPVHEPDQLVRVYSSWNNREFGSSSYPEYQAVLSRTDVFSGVTAHRRARVSVGQGDQTTMEQAQLATGNYFQVVGVTPALGRFFSPAEDAVTGADAVVVVSYALWQGRLGGDPAVIGSALHISGRPYTIVGVTQPTMLGAEPEEEDVVVWLPFMSFRHVLGVGDEYLQQNWHGIAMTARLRADATIEQARASSAVAARAIAEAHGNEWQDLRLTVVPGGTLASAQASGEIGIIFILLNVVVGLVLLIACANVANIVLARGMSRRREIAIRLSLGSGRLRLVQQLLIESVLLGLAGGVVGLLLALWSADLLRALELPSSIDPTPDGRVLIYALVVATATGIIFGLLPALQSTRVSLTDALKQASRLGAPLRSRLRSALVIGQISLSVVLLVLAGLFLRTLFELRTAPSGVNETGMLAVELDLTTLGLAESEGQLLFDRITERMASLPGVQAVTLSTIVPGAGRFWGTGATLPDVEGMRDHEFPLGYNTIDANYVSALGVRLIRGRPLTERDLAGQPDVALVNETFVRQYLGNVDPIGQHIRTGRDRNWQIVGVMSDVRYDSGEQVRPMMFVSYHQLYHSNLTLQVRAIGDPGALIAPIRRELYDLYPGLAGTYRTFADLRRASVGAPGVVTSLLSIFGGLALFLAALGLYGVTAYVVTLRTQEIGVRMALGARPAGVLGLFARQGLRLALIGGSAGLVLALAAGKLMSAELYGVSAFDPIVLGSVVIIMGAVAMVASVLPARRAASVDPVTALHAE